MKPNLESIINKYTLHPNKMDTLAYWWQDKYLRGYYEWGHRLPLNTVWFSRDSTHIDLGSACDLESAQRIVDEHNRQQMRGFFETAKLIRSLCS